MTSDGCGPVGWEVRASCEVLQQGRPGRRPPEVGAGDRTRRRHVQCEEPADPPEVRRDVLLGDGHDGDVDAASDARGDRSRVAMPSSATACTTVPAGACSRARRTNRAASSRWTAGQRFSPVPTYPDRPRATAIPTSVATKPWSPWPCTVGAKRTPTARTPRPVKPSARPSLSPRGASGPETAGRSCSVASRPAASPATPDATSSGRSVPSSVVQSASTAARSVRPAPA